MQWKARRNILVLVLACGGFVARAEAQDTQTQTSAPAAGDPLSETPPPPAATAPQPVAPQPVTPLYTSAPMPASAPEPEGSIKDITVHHRPMALSVLAFVPWWYGIGIGTSIAYEIPVVHDGFIPKVNDQFSIEPSFSFAYTTWRNTARGFDNDYALMFRPAVAALWSFHFSPRLRAYAEVNLGYTRVNRYYDFGNRGVNFGYNYFYGELNVGVFFNVSKRVSLRGEVGFFGLRAGVAFLI